MNMRMVLVFASGLLSIFAQIALADYSQHPKGVAFVDRMVAEHGFEAAEVKRVLAAAEKKQAIIDAMTRPAEKVKPWKDYRQIFISEKRISEGVRFWQDNREALVRAEQKYGVAPEVVVAIIGVETFYGRIKGSWRVVDALATLGFDYPSRGAFFTRQLEEFLLLAREQRKDPFSLTGSYAGAMGYGQFIPSSYRSFAVDFDGDGFADLWDNPTDAIGSVANYFAEHHWQAGQPVVSRARVTEGYDEQYLNKLKLVKTIAELKALGFTPLDTLPDDMRAIPFRLEGKRGAEFWLGLPNFYTITRYNRSRLYAMTVHQLSQLIRERVATPDSSGAGAN